MSSEFTYAVETFEAVWPEMKPLWDLHWQEVALDHGNVKLDPDIQGYLALENLGMLHVVCMRKQGRLVGYHISFVKPHLHYASTLHSFADVFFVKPEFRVGFAGIRMLKEVERTLAQRGVKKMMTGTKLHDSPVTGKSLDMSRIFRRLGWRETEHIFTKCIGGSE